MNPFEGKRSPASGITRRLLRVVVLQLLFISVITALGVVVAAKVVEGVMMRTALEGEARHFWEHYLGNPAHPLPNTDNLIGYLQLPDSESSVPAELASVEPGYGRVEMDGRRVLVLVEQAEVPGGNAMLYLVFDEESVARLSFYFGVVPLSLVLIVIYLSAWVAFRQSRKAVSPIVSLAGHLRDFHSGDQPEIALDLDRFRSGNDDDEVNALVDSLNAFTGEINELIQRERRFTRDASHELRTPLSVIQGSAELLAASRPLDTGQRRSVERIRRTTRDMNDLVTTLLLLARGHLRGPGTGDVSLNDVIRHQLEQLHLTHNTGNSLEIILDLHPGVQVRATRQLVEAVCGNLLRNAFNYTREGEIVVRLRPGKLSVTNRGPGVSAPPDEDLFEPFRRGVDESQVEGYGVGLDLVRRLCELYGWTVDAQYDKESGMTFRVVFAAVS